LVEHIYAQIEVETITLYEESTRLVQHETEIEIDSHRSIAGIEVIVSIPYTGDPLLWRVRPNRGRLVIPRGNIRLPTHEGIGHLDIAIVQPTNVAPNEVKQQLN
jgi:hypothetical protein